MTTEKEIQQWNRFYASFEKLMRIPDIRLVRELAGVDVEGKAALVLGCGNGRHTIYLGQRGWHVVAVDYSEEALHKLRVWAEKERVQSHIVTMRVDLKAPNVPLFNDFGGKFDLVLAWSVLDYFTDEEVLQLLEWLPSVCTVDAQQLIIWVRGEKDRIHNPLFDSSDGFMKTEKRNHNDWRSIFGRSAHWMEPVIDERWETFGQFNEHYYLIRSVLK